MIIKYVGLTAEAAALLESLRTRPDQAEWEIIVQALRPDWRPAPPLSTPVATVDLGQGVRLEAGERLHLFLTERAKRAMQADGVAEVRQDGLYVEGVQVQPSRGSPLQPAMKIFQKRLGHAVWVSALRQWHVMRGNRFVPLTDVRAKDHVDLAGTAERAEFLTDKGAP